MPAFTWQTIGSSVMGPGNRSRHGLAHDRNEGATLLFGGIVWVAGGILKADTWALTQNGWSQIKLKTAPAPRHRGAMVFDEGRGFTVLFGGQGNAGQMFGDTWTFSERRWKKLTTWSWRRPSPRAGHSLAYDEQTRETVLFGGVGRLQRSLSDTWVFDGTVWRRVLGPHPPARRYAAFAYDPVLRGCLLHGGSVDDAGARQFGGTWLYRDRTWTRLPSEFDTDIRDDHGLAFHRKAGVMVMLDGNQGARGILIGSADGWQAVSCEPLHPRHQCSPLAWDERLGGLVLHGGEAYHNGPQFNSTLVLHLAPSPAHAR